MADPADRAAGLVVVRAGRDSADPVVAHPAEDSVAPAAVSVGLAAAALAVAAPAAAVLVLETPQAARHRVASKPTVGPAAALAAAVEATGLR